MIQTRFLTILFSAICLFTIVSCGDDVDCDDVNSINTELASLNADVNNATTAFNSDPTNGDLCDDVVDTIQELLSFSRDIQDCIPAADQAAFSSNLTTLESNLDILDCN